MGTHTKVILHLSLVEGVGAATINHILKSKAWSAEGLADLYNYTVNDFREYHNIPERRAQALVAGLNSQKEVEKELELLEQTQTKIITSLCSSYPTLLSEIHIPPPLLYTRGDVSLLERDAVAIVGSRQADNYAKRVVESFIPSLVNYRIVIVSGGALGVDSFAHEAALAAGGKTIVVLGSGLERLYPPIHKKLFECIVAEGSLLVSPFGLTTQPAPGNFPARNRIIAGLSKGCLVVQAGVQSGARITAMFALEQGREVFAVPGMIDHPLSVGCHLLLREGATLVTKPEDILEQLGYAVKVPHSAKTEVRTEEMLVVAKKDAEEISFDNEEQRKVYEVCHTPQSLDMILETTALSMFAIQSSLFDLQIKMLIQQDSIGRWQRCT